MPTRLNPLKNDRGVALMLVVFMVALATILVMSVASSSYLGSRRELASARALQAEYLLKSALNIAIALIKEDTSPEDGFQDPTWGPFVNGRAIPGELLELPQPNIQIELEIRPEETKIPIKTLLPSSLSGGPDPIWRGVLTRLFQNLGFDEDKEQDHTGLFPQRVFGAEEMVANLVDYMDRDNESYQDANGAFASGIEGELPADTFPNQQIKRVGEIANIPGFTPARVQRLLPLLTGFGDGRRVNINLAPKVVLKSLSAGMSDQNVEDIIAFRMSEQGPFTLHNKTTELAALLGDTLSNEVNSYLDVEAKWFQIIAKVDYGTSTFFLRGYVQETQTGQLPIVRSTELF